MLDKMFGVSPPLKGEAQDSKLAHSKDFRGTSKSEYKKDFEKALEKKLDQKNENLEGENEATQKTEELRADKKDRKSLGGTKKKVTEDDDKMISNLMASKESKVEIPDSKIEDLAEIKVDTTEKSKASVETEVKAASAGQLPNQLANQTGLIQNQIETPKAVALETSVQLLQLNKQPVSEISSKLIEGKISTEPIADLPQQTNTLPALTQFELPATPQLQEQFQEKVQKQAFNLDAELGKEVGYTVDPSGQQTNKDLLQKMKAFDVDKNTTSNKSESFEQNVLSRLQNEQTKSVAQVTEQKFSGESQNGSEQQRSGQGSEKSSDRFKDLKTDVLDANQLHQATGQTHSEFKTHVLGVSASEQSLAGKLTENREANINEIMNQAQYLVKKGGGEVSVVMNPEGLGEVHLKVLFQDGKLNIELQTQNKDVKKMIEDSLSELKSGLAAQRLSLEHVKVDTVNATNADNNTQFQSNLNHGGSQEQARELWKDYQGNMNNQSGKKSSYADSSGQSNVSAGSSAAKAVSTAGALRTYGGTKGATVNRVA